MTYPQLTSLNRETLQSLLPPEYSQILDEEQNNTITKLQAEDSARKTAILACSILVILVAAGIAASVVSGGSSITFYEGLFGTFITSIISGYMLFKIYKTNRNKQEINGDFQGYMGAKLSHEALLEELLKVECDEAKMKSVLNQTDDSFLSYVPSQKRTTFQGFIDVTRERRLLDICEVIEKRLSQLSTQTA